MLTTCELKFFTAAVGMCHGLPGPPGLQLLWSTTGAVPSRGPVGPTAGEAPLRGAEASSWWKVESGGSADCLICIYISECKKLHVYLMATGYIVTGCWLVNSAHGGLSMVDRCWQHIQVDHCGTGGFQRLRLHPLVSPNRCGPRSAASLAAFQPLPAAVRSLHLRSYENAIFAAAKWWVSALVNCHSWLRIGVGAICSPAHDMCFFNF